MQSNKAMQKVSAMLEDLRNENGDTKELLRAVYNANYFAMDLSDILINRPIDGEQTRGRNDIITDLGQLILSLAQVQTILGITEEEVTQEEILEADAFYNIKEKRDSYDETREKFDRMCPMCLYNGADPFSMPCIYCKTKPGNKGFTPKK